MASGIYAIYKTNLMSKKVNCSSGGDVILVALANSDHAFLATDSAYSDVSANCIASGGGYTTGGNALLQTVATSAGTAIAVFDGTDAVWSSASFTANHAILYMSSDGGLVCSVDFGGAKVVSNGTFTIQWNGKGIITLA